MNTILIYCGRQSLICREPRAFPDPNKPGNELAVWDVSDGVGPFQHLGHFEAPPDILAGAAAVNARMHPWDKPPRLRQPRDRPQLELDLDEPPKPTLDQLLKERLKR